MLRMDTGPEIVSASGARAENFKLHEKLDGIHRRVLLQWRDKIGCSRNAAALLHNKASK